MSLHRVLLHETQIPHTHARPAALLLCEVPLGRSTMWQCSIYGRVDEMSPAPPPPPYPLPNPPPPARPPTPARPLLGGSSMTGGRQGGQGRIDEQGRIFDITDAARDLALQLP